MTSKTGRAKVREEFMKNAHVQDIRVIDMLVIKVIPWIKKNFPSKKLLHEMRFYFCS